MTRRRAEISLPILLIAALAAPACQDPAGPPAREREAVPIVQELAQRFLTVAQTRLDLVETVRAEVEQTLDLSLRNDAAGNEFPAEYRGATIARNGSTHAYELGDAPGAPSDGVRVLLYRRTATGAFLIPLAVAGHVDFTVRDFAGEGRLGLRGELEGEELFNLIEESVTSSAVRSIRLAGEVMAGAESIAFQSYHAHGDESRETSLELRIGTDPQHPDLTTGLHMTEDLGTGAAEGELYAHGAAARSETRASSGSLLVNISFEGAPGNAHLAGEARYGADDGQEAVGWTFAPSGSPANLSFTATSEDAPPGLAAVVGDFWGAAVQAVTALLEPHDLAPALP